MFTVYHKASGITVVENSYAGSEGKRGLFQKNAVSPSLWQGDESLLRVSAADLSSVNTVCIGVSEVAPTMKHFAREHFKKLQYE